MTDRKQELLALTDQFVDAFNRMNLDDVVSFFEEDLGLLLPNVIDFTITLVSSCLWPIFLLVFFLGRIL